MGVSESSLVGAGGLFLLVGDETVAPKSGKQTHGLERFFSSIDGKVVPGLSFFGVALVSVEQQESTMLLMEPVSRGESTTKQGSQPKPRGRPKGSKNHPREEVELPASLQKIQGYFQPVLTILGDQLAVPYAVLDGAFGHNNALQMVRGLDLHLISKLNCNAALYFPYRGEQQKTGRRRIYY
jgi:putative transposase